MQQELLLIRFSFTPLHGFGNCRLKTFSNSLTIDSWGIQVLVFKITRKIAQVTSRISSLGLNYCDRSLSRFKFGKPRVVVA